jgi:hypothetical protein
MNKVAVISTDSCGWPNLTKLNNGHVLCTYFDAPSHGLMEGDLVCSISDSNGQNWKKLSVVAKRPKGGNRMHLAVGLAHNGDILCFSSGFFVKDEKFTGFSGHWLSRSNDGGKSWRSETNPIVPNGIESTIPFGRIIQIGRNQLAYSSYRSQGKGNPSQSWMISSHDDGRTWTQKSKFGKDDSSEATLCKLSNGRLFAATRTHIDHHVKLCELSESKARWKEKRILTLPMQHPADLTVLSDKCLLLTYGIRNRGLMGIGARFSIDGGETWRPPWVIHQFGDSAKDIGYPSTISLDKKGSLLTAFYTDYEPGLKTKPNRYRVLAKRWLLSDWIPPSTYAAIFAGKEHSFQT